MAKLTYADKVNLSEKTSIPAINKITDDDMNEIKTVVNGHDNLIGQVLDGTLVATLNDDNAISFTPDDNYGVILIGQRHFTGAEISSLVVYRSTSTLNFCKAIVTPTAVVPATGILTGTTGTDGKFTISAHTDGKIYIENRTGSTVSFSYLVFGM